MNANSRPAWKAVTYRAGKGRAQDRHWVVGPNRQRIGFFPTLDEAQKEADRLNALEPYESHIA